MSSKKRSRRKKKGPPSPRTSPKPEAGRTNKNGKAANIQGDRRAGSRKIRLILAGLLVVAAAGTAVVLLRPKKTPVLKDGKLNVLLITLDTTRADRLGCYGYAAGKTPNIDAIAHNGVLFADSYAQVPLTLASHASIMTGMYPIGHNVRNNGAYVLSSDKITLAKILKDQGFKTAAFVSSFSVDSRFGLDQGFDVYDDDFQDGAPFKAMNAERKAEEVYGPFSAWLDKIRDEQFFCWVHFFDPHLPYNPPSPYREQFADRPYDGEIAYLDYIIGLVMRKLREKELLGRTLVVVAGDHGEGFGEHGESGHGVFLYDDTLKVPLIFYAEHLLPAQKIISSRVRLIDVMPTILDLLDRPKPETVQGTSLVAYILNKKNGDLDTYLETVYPKENFGWSPLFGFVSGRWKYIRAPKEELYDLKADPNESRNVISADVRTASTMKSGLDRLIKSVAAPGAGGGRTLTAEEQDRLRSLGYVFYADKTSKGEAADPKDKIEELEMIQDAEKREFQGDLQAAADLYEKMLALRPDSASSYVSLALIQARLKKFDDALRTLKRGIERIPGSEILMSRLGYTYLVTGRLDDAFAAMAEVLKINPRYLDALTASAVILDNQEKKEEARVFFERALAVEPENKFLRMSYAQNLAAAGRVPETVEIYERLKRDYPKDPLPRQLLGFSYSMMKDYDKAIDNLKEAIALKPSPPAYYVLAMSFKEKGNAEEALRCLELYLQDTAGENPGRVKNARAGAEVLKKSLNK